MVTDDELGKIVKLRGQGLTHQEIADRLGLTRQTVAYQLSKKKENASIEKPVRVIRSKLQNAGNITILKLSIQQFEELRESDMVYQDNCDLFEMRGNCIHSCSSHKWFIDNYDTLPLTFQSC